MAEAKRDGNFIPTLLAVSSTDGVTPVVLYADPVTHRLYVDISGSAGTGTVQSVSVATINGISGTVATATTTPVITLTLGAITPSSIAGTTFTGNNTFSLSNTFTHLPTCTEVPSASNQLINKAYADLIAQGLSVRASCDLATTANITLSGEQTIDSITTNASRILVKNQTLQENNGIYTTGSGAWTRVSDYDTAGEITKGSFTAILTGTANGNTIWVQTNTVSTVGVDPIAFSKLQSTSGTGTVTSVSVVSANGFTGSVATSTTTPAITLTCSANGVLQSDGTTITAKAVSGSGDIVLKTGASLVNKSSTGTDSGTETLQNKRITKRAPAVTQSATPTINTDVTDVAHITGLAQAITSMTTNLSGTPVEGDTLRIDITDNGTGRAITWGASFESSTVTLPTTTVASTRLDIGFIWNSVTSKWRCVATA